MANEIRLSITGMTCEHCVARASKALQNVANVEQVVVTLDPGEAIVSGTPSADELIAAVGEAGYEATI